MSRFFSDFSNRQSSLVQLTATGGLLLGAACWGVVWYPYRLLEQAGISGIAASLYTYAMASLFGMLLFYRGWRHLRKLPISIFWLALAAGWTNLSYVLAVIDGEVMRVMLLFYLSPLWTLILAHFWLKERTGLRGLLVIAVSLAGALIMLWQPNELPLPQNNAEWLALFSGIGFALTNAITRKSSHLSVGAKSVAVWLGVFAMAFAFVPFESTSLPMPESFSAAQWGMMVLVALLLLSATLGVQFGLTHVPVTRASVLFLFELVVAAVAAYFLAGETLSLQEWIGGILIVSAALFASHVEQP